MATTFLHTADWQLGKPFVGVEDVQKRSLLQTERFRALEHIGRLARQHDAAFILVAGDLFDSPSPTEATVSAACSAIGSLKLPVYAIPGNHDHGGADSLWQQEFFRREQEQLAPNLHLLLQPQPLILPGAVLFPCPLLRRHVTLDPTRWLRELQEDPTWEDKPRIVIAHGSTQDFGSTTEDEEEFPGSVNRLDLASLPHPWFDYVALGDWHGTKQVGERAWYAGTPEPDRFLKGADHRPGQALVVQATRDQAPVVQPVPVGEIGWHQLSFHFADASGLERLQQLLEEKVGSRVNRDLLHLHLKGSLGIHACARLEELLHALSARLIRLKLDNQTVLDPSEEELARLTRRPQDPLLSRVACRLLEMADGPEPESTTARVGLRRLFQACHDC